MPGRSTLTATSRPSCSVAKCTWAIDALATGLGVEAGKELVDAPPEGLLDQRGGLGGRKRRHAVLQLGQFVGHVQRQQVAPRRQHLAELDEDRAEPFQRQAQAHAARLIEAAAERDRPRQRAHPALPEARHRQLVESEAQHGEHDEHQPHETPHGGGRRALREARKPLAAPCAGHAPAPSRAGAAGRPPRAEQAAPCRPRRPSAGSAAASSRRRPAGHRRRWSPRACRPPSPGPSAAAGCRHRRAPPGRPRPRRHCRRTTRACRPA